jgi:putative DNA primase/helicase
MEASEATAAEYIEYVDGKKHAARNADTTDNIKFFKDAGKKLRDDEIVVDIDKLPIGVIKKMISYFNIQTEIRWTDNGVHMYFKKPKGYKPKAEGICALGFEVEWKTSKNSPNGVTVKRNGIERPVENEDVREELPDFFTYIKGAENLLGLQEGDGRDNKLYKHKFKVLHLKNDKKILRFINENIFAEPLKESDFNRITRHEIDSKQNTAYEVAMQIKKKLKVVKFCERLYFYDGTCYRDDNFKFAVASELKGESMRYINEIFGQIEIHTEPIEEPSTGWTIKFKNGCLHNGKWFQLDYLEFTPFYIDVAYNPNAETIPIVDKFLENLSEGDKDYRDYLIEIIAHCLITNLNVKRNKNFQRVTFLMGGGGNGKGTYLLVIRALLGANNVSSISLDRIIDERYLCSMLGKLANLGDDIEDKPINSEKMKMLKNLSAYDVIPFRELYKKSRNEASFASQIFTTNHLLKSFEKDESWKRRANWCPVFGKPKANDPHFQEKLTSPEALEYWLKLVMEAYERLMENRKFTESKKVKDYTEFYHMENNTVLLYLEPKQQMDFIEKQRGEAYREYEVWAEEQGLNVQSMKTFNKTVEERLDLYLHNTTRNKSTVVIWRAKKTK